MPPGSSPPADRWLHGRRPNPRAALRLFCFPHSGAGASTYRGWPEALPATVEACPVQLPGRETRMSEPAFRRVSDLVPALADGLRPWLDRPFAFFGHSLGAIVAFELARHLRSLGRPGPARLVVSAHRGPRFPGDTRIHGLPDDEFEQQLREMGGTPDEVLRNGELKQLLFPILRADFEMSETYQYAPGEPLDCPVSAYGGLQDRHVGRDTLQPWRDETRGVFQLRMFPGGHFFVQERRVDVIHALSRDLTAAG
jgi:medium-chain acyl-[acyl-carrier-protein] hydrolase